MGARTMRLTTAVALVVGLAAGTAPPARGLEMTPPTTSFDVGAEPVAVAVGDLDRDGTPDVAVANRGSADASILLGDGSTGLTSAGTYEMSPRPGSVALGDINRDGVLDLLTAGDDRSRVHYRMGAGSGSFKTLRSVPTGAAPPDAIAVADLNGDGRLDIVTANPGTVSVLRGDGRGEFEPAGDSPYSSAVDGDAVAVGDMNGDGRRDVVVSSEQTQAVAVLLGTGSGRLVFASVETVSPAPADLRLARIDGDAHLDAVVARPGASDVVVLHGNGTGGFTGPATSVALDHPARVLALSDANADRAVDVLAADAAMSILLADTVGGLTAATGGPWDLGGDVSAIAAADLDADGRDDVVAARADLGDVTVVANESTQGLTVDPPAVDFGPHGRGTASEPVTVSVWGTGLPTHVEAVDIEGDGFEVSADGCSGRTTGDGRAPCSVEVSFSPAEAAAYTGTLRVRSDAGDRTVALSGSGIDADPPDTTIVDRPSDPTTDTTPTFTFVSSEDGSTFACGLDGDDVASCTSPYTTAELAPGSHTFEVAATDAAGNTDRTPASYRFTLVTETVVAPDTTITEHPGSLTNDTTPSFRFTSDSAGATFVCTLDGGEAVPCASPHTLDELAEGTHSFSVAAVGPTGAIDPTPDTHDLEVDITRPRTAISGPKRATRRNARYTFRFSEDVAVVRCSIDGSGFSECKTPYSARSLKHGRHVLRVQAVDAAGNVESPAVTKRFRIVRTG